MLTLWYNAVGNNPNSMNHQEEQLAQLVEYIVENRENKEVVEYLLHELQEHFSKTMVETYQKGFQDGYNLS